MPITAAEARQELERRRATQRPAQPTRRLGGANATPQMVERPAWESTPEANRTPQVPSFTPEQQRQLEIDTAVENARQRARREYSVLPDQAGIVTPIVSAVADPVEGVLDRGRETLGIPGGREDRIARDRRWARGARQASEDILAEGHGGQLMDWAASLPEAMRQASEIRAEEDRGRELNMYDRSLLRPVVETVGDFWTGMSSAGRDARGEVAAADARRDYASRDWEIANARGDEAFNRGDMQGAGEADIAARSASLTRRIATEEGDQAAGADFWTNAPWALEFAPEFGMVQSLARFPARVGLRAAGQEVPEALARPNLLSETQRPGVRTGEVTPNGEDVLYSATGNAQGWRNNAAAGGGAYLAADSIDGEMGDDPTQNALIAGGVMAAGRNFIPNIDTAIPAEIQQLMRQGEVGADGARNYTPRPRQRLTVDPEGRVAMDYEGSFNTGDGASVGETRSVMRGAREALDRDIRDTRRSEYSWTPNDERQAALYRGTFERDTPINYAFSETPEGTMRLRRLGAEFEPDPIQAQPVPDSAPFGFEGAPQPSRVIDAEATPAVQRNFEAAVRDPQNPNGRPYTGEDHQAAIDSIPDEATRARLQAIYDAPTEDPRVIGFNVNGQFMGREEGLQSLRSQRRPVRVGEQYNVPPQGAEGLGPVTPRDPINWDDPRTRLSADEEEFRRWAGQGPTVSSDIGRADRPAIAGRDPLRGVGDGGPNENRYLFGSPEATNGAEAGASSGLDAGPVQGGRLPDTDIGGGLRRLGSDEAYIDYRAEPYAEEWFVTHQQIDDPAMRGQGLGVSAYEELIGRAREAGASAVVSDTRVSGDARRVYEALRRRGYSVVERDGRFHVSTADRRTASDGPRFRFAGESRFGNRNYRVPLRDGIEAELKISPEGGVSWGLVSEGGDWRGLSAAERSDLGLRAMRGIQDALVEDAGRFNVQRYGFEGSSESRNSLYQFLTRNADQHGFAVGENNGLMELRRSSRRTAPDGGATRPEISPVVPPPPEGARRLYNASTVDHDPNGYLDPHVSGWVEEIASGAGDFDNIGDVTRPLVYMSDSPESWVRMIVGRKIGKHPTEVTMEDIRANGRLNIVDADPEYDNIFQVGDYSRDGSVTTLAGERKRMWETNLYDSDEFSEMPVGPEPNDFIARESVSVSHSLTGDDLVRFLEQNSSRNAPNAGPRRLGDNDAAAIAGVATTGAAGAYTADQLFNQEANASDGTDTGGNPIVPILGAGVTLAALEALRRGRLGQSSRSQVGMFAGVNARTADRAALARAEELAASGASRDAIWQETGWFQGVDGKWRFEIDDSGAQIAPDMLERHSRASVGGSQRRPLSEGLQHPELNDAYDLSDTTLDFGRLSRGAVGEYDNSRRSISMYAADDPDMLRSGTLHETQHRVQREEGFATGGTPESAWGVNEQASLDAIRAQKKEALGGRDPYAIQNRIAAGYRVADEDMAALEQWRALTRQEDEILANTLSPREAYRRLGGETEARNVQTRRNMTPEQRARRAPWETQDVPDDQQIVRFDGGRAESRPRRLGEMQSPVSHNDIESGNGSGTLAQQNERAGRREWTSADLSRARQMQSDGASVRAIGAELGRSPGDVSRRLRGGEVADRVEGGATAYVAANYTRVLDAAEQMAERFGGRLPGNYTDELASATGYEPASVKQALAFIRSGGLGEEAAARAGRIQGQRGVRNVNLAYVTEHINDESLAHNPDVMLDRLNAHRQGLGMDPTTPSAVRQAMSQARRDVAGLGDADRAARRERMRETRRRPDALDAIAPIGITGAGVALAFGDEAQAQELPVQNVGDLQVDPNTAPPSMTTAVGAPTVYDGDIYVQEFSDGTRHAFRMNRGDGRADPEYVGQILGSSVQSERVGDVYNHAYDNSQMSEPYSRPQQPRRRLGGSENVVRPALAAAAGIGANLLVPGRYGPTTRMAASGLTAAGVDTVLGGDLSEALPVGAATAGGTEFLRAGANETVRRLAADGSSAALAFDPAFQAQRDAFAQTLPDVLPTARVTDTRNYHGEIQRPDEGLFGAQPITVPDSEMAAQGYAYNRPVENMPSQREQFLDAPAAVQMEWMRRAERNRPSTAADPERVARGREIQRRLGEARPPAREAADPFVDPNSGSSVFGEQRRPRAPRAPLPPVADRAEAAGAQGAMRGVKAAPMREIADDLGIASQGRPVGELRKAIVRELGRRFDSTREMVAFLGRYGVTAAALGIGIESMSEEPQPQRRRLN